MSISAGVNIAVMNVSNHRRLTAAELGARMERMENGVKINHGKDDPSGLAIGANMKARLRGLETAIQNIQDGLNLVRSADKGFSIVQDLLMRIRDLALRGANQATMNTVVGQASEDPFSDTRQIFREIRMLQVEIYRMSGDAADPGGQSFNGKKVFHEFAEGRQLQIGPDTGSPYSLEVVIPDMKAYGIPLYTPPPGNIDSDAFTAAFQLTITNADAAIDDVSGKRAELGTQENRLLSVLNDISAEIINISSAHSKIMDADIAVEMTELAKANIMSRTSDAALIQANSAPQAVYSLLDAAGLDASQRVEVK